MKWYEYAKRLMADKKIKQDDLLNTFGVKTRGAVGHYLTGRRQPDPAQLKRLAEKLGCSLDELMQGESKPPSNAGYLLGIMEEWDKDTPLHKDDVELPYFREVELSAGNGRHEVIENHGEKLRFSKATLKKAGVQIECAYCVKVSGASMEPVFPKGTTVGIDTADTMIKDGKAYAIDHYGELRVKLIYKTPGGGIRLRSYNPEYSDEFLSSMEGIRILGRVFWSSVLW